MDLHETLTHDVYQLAIEHYLRDFFGYRPPKILGPKTTHFQRLCNLMATLSAIISGAELDRHNREMPVKATEGPLTS